MADAPLLRIDDLRVHFRTDAGTVRAVDGVSYEVRAGETLAVVGESGCGKSMTALALLRLVPPPGHIVSGSIVFRGENLVSATEERLRELRGNELAMVFQEPMTSLNPVFTIGNQIGEVLALHLGLDDAECRTETLRLLALVGIPAPEQRIDEYPHRLSGGMRQRVMIAMALACNPELLIADEPTTALDVTVQAQILELLADLQERLGMGVLLITHDLGVVAETARRVVVMYAGLVVEQASAAALFARPRHPYTAGLFRSLPAIGGPEGALRPIEGRVPDALNFPPGCRFHPRCPHAMPRCREEEPPLVDRAADGDEPHLSACFFVDEHPEVDLLADPEPLADPGPKEAAS
ncbi:MAG TPA: ABC transporter ATP-binding protein [Polyangiaceae bacterium]|jgi:oligopeptide/dipeptide ABC transporter ATP-binding protein|nr:ABC transporter ATP-binding protein [Polyangiaceae bacterium]